MFGLRFPRDTREHTTSYYAATASQGAPYPTLENRIKSDVVIVGGGFSGVNLAVELCERGFEVTLLEANRIGWGASGRNGGQIIGGLGHDPGKFKGAIGAEGVETIYRMGIECVDVLRERVEKYAIDCDIKWGYCDVALKPKHMQWFRDSKQEQEAAGYPHELVLLDKEEVKEFVGSDAYLGGLYNARGGGHLHPLNLCQGEARAAQEMGARIYEQSRVLRLEPGETTVVHTERGAVEARRVVLAGNAYMGGLVPYLSKRVLPASSCMIATEPLSEEQASSVLPRDVAVCDPRTALDYFRLSADRRMLFGGLSNYTGLVPDNYEKVMTRKMLKIFPQLAGVRIDYAWDGQLGIGINRMPQTGMLDDNTYYIQAYSGHGVAPTHIMARVVAEALDGNSRRFDIMKRIQHMAFPGGRYLRRPGMALGMLYYKSLDYI
ncbi:MAG: FAD-binding oxidoreductase [Halieaceae bacterium]|jgi:glycine/D-amino acid oxidase-like deaminating enzyme|nr:FAD-binding oxidoreductase [Halieaceae bacterium]